LAAHQVPSALKLPLKSIQNKGKLIPQEQPKKSNENITELSLICKTEAMNKKKL